MNESKAFGFTKKIGWIMLVVFGILAACGKLFLIGEFIYLLAKTDMSFGGIIWEAVKTVGMIVVSGILAMIGLALTQD